MAETAAPDPLADWTFRREETWFAELPDASGVQTYGPFSSEEQARDVTLQRVEEQRALAAPANEP